MDQTLQFWIPAFHAESGKEAPLFFFMSLPLDNGPKRQAQEASRPTIN